MKKYIKILFCLILFSFFCGNIFAQDVVIVPPETFVNCVEKKANFVGGEKAMMQWLGKNLRMPTNAENVSGTFKVYCQFKIDTLGNVTNVKVTKSSKMDVLDDEAVRVIQAMPKWKPAEQDCKKVTSFYTLPIVFKLEEELKIQMIKE